MTGISPSNIDFGSGCTCTREFRGSRTMLRAVTIYGKLFNLVSKCLGYNICIYSVTVTVAW